MRAKLQVDHPAWRAFYRRYLPSGDAVDEHADIASHLQHRLGAVPPGSFVLSRVECEHGHNVLLTGPHSGDSAQLLMTVFVTSLPDSVNDHAQSLPLARFATGLGSRLSRRRPVASAH